MLPSQGNAFGFQNDQICQKRPFQYYFEEECAPVCKKQRTHEPEEENTYDYSKAIVPVVQSTLPTKDMDEESEESDESNTQNSMSVKYTPRKTIMGSIPKTILPAEYYNMAIVPFVPQKPKIVLLEDEEEQDKMECD